MALHELKELGRGAFGRVYLAHDDELGKPVAVKELLDPQADLDRLEREARLLSEQIRNMYVVNIYRWDLSPPKPHLVLEYCEGGSLRSWVGKANWQQAAAILLQAANGILGIHSVDGIHRDIKPENMLLARAPNGDGFIVKVADFGLARRPKTAQPPMTRSPGGTPGYMAPELGSPTAQFFAPSDIYSLGIVGIELMTGSTSPASLTKADVPNDFKNLLNRMVSDWSPLRPSIADVIIALGQIIRSTAPPAVVVNSVAPHLPPPGPQPPAPRFAPRPQPAPAPPPAAPARSGGGAGLAGLLLLFGGVAAAAAIAAGNKSEWDDDVGRYRGSDGRFRRG